MCYKEQNISKAVDMWDVVMSHVDSSENLQNRILVVSAMIAVILLLTKIF